MEEPQSPLQDFTRPSVWALAPASAPTEEEGEQGRGAGLCGCHGPWTPSVIRVVLALAWGFVTCLGP